jgi:hypothetical protein
MLSEVTACIAYSYENVAIVSRRIEYYLNEVDYTFLDWGFVAAYIDNKK